MRKGVNNVFIRGGTLVVGIFFYEEKYTWKQIVGIYLLMNK